MDWKSANFNDAPPIKPPSTSGKLNISSAFVGFTLPPYKILIEFDHKLETFQDSIV